MANASTDSGKDIDVLYPTFDVLAAVLANRVVRLAGSSDVVLPRRFDVALRYGQDTVELEVHVVRGVPKIAQAIIRPRRSRTAQELRSVSLAQCLDAAVAWAAVKHQRTTGGVQIAPWASESSDSLVRSARGRRSGAARQRQQPRALDYKRQRRIAKLYRQAMRGDPEYQRVMRAYDRGKGRAPSASARPRPNIYISIVEKISPDTARQYVLRVRDAGLLRAPPRPRCVGESPAKVR